MSTFSKAEIGRLLKALNAELASTETKGELYLVGGAVMCLVFEAREATKDIDSYFLPTNKISEASRRIATRENLPENWLNDAVKGFLSEHGTFNQFADYTHLKIFAPTPDYMLAMKCLAMRLGAEFQDEADVRYLLMYLNITKSLDAVTILKKFYPIERYPQKTFYALEEILGT